MKRILIIVLLILILVGGYFLVTEGLVIAKANFSVSSYSEIGELSNSLTMSVAAYNKKNNTEYTETLTSLSTSINNYKTAKAQYEDLIAEMGSEEETIDEETEEIIYSTSFTVYEIDFLWATIGNYAKSEGLTITMNVNKATVSSSSESVGYDLYNLAFDVSGEYINIANFLYDLEDDDKLAFEIRDFSMSAGNATFTIYNVPLNSETLLDIASTLESTDAEGEVTEDGTDGTDSVGDDTITSDSTSTDETTNTNTNTDNTTNTASNTTTTNNTTN